MTRVRLSSQALRAMLGAIALAVLGATVAAALAPSDLQAHARARAALRQGDLVAARQAWDSLLVEDAATHAVVVARPCGDWQAEVARRRELAPLWVAGPAEDDCFLVLWGHFASESEALVAADRLPASLREDGPVRVVRLRAPMADALDARIAVTRAVAVAPSETVGPESETASAPAPVEAVQPVPLPTVSPSSVPASPREEVVQSAPPPRTPAPPIDPDSLIGAAPPPGETAATLFVRGNEAYARGDFDEAIRAFEGALAIDSNNPRTFNNLGTAWLLKGDAPRAEAAFRRAAQLDPSYARAFLNLGSALYAQDRLPEARIELERAMRLDPENLDARTNLAALLVEQRDWPRALAVLEDALRLAPSDENLLEQAEQVRAQLGVRQARPASMADRSPVAGSGLAASGADAAALTPRGATPGPCAETVSRERRAHLARKLFQDGRSAYVRGDFVAAGGLLERALECDPTSPAILNHLGAARLSAGQTASAASAFELALEMDPDHREAGINLALALHDMGRCQDAVERLRELTRKWPDSGEAHFQLGRLLFSCGRPTEALTALESAKDLLPGDSRPRRLQERLEQDRLTAP